MIEVKDILIKLDGEGILETANFKFEQTGLYLVLGNNGAGKTTLLKSICGLQSLVSGSILMNGKEVHSLSLPERSSWVQYVDDPFPIPAFIQLVDYLALGYTYNKERLEAAVKSFKLDQLADKDVSNFSRGQQQKAMLAKLFYGDQPIWLLDEPSNYLDYPSLLHFWKAIQLKAKDKLIIATLHNPEEALKLDAEIVMIKDKGLVKMDNPSLERIIEALAQD